MKKFLCVFFVSTSIFALGYREVLPFRLLKVYPGNVIAIDRGLEDDVQKGDHIKIINERGYVARGINIKSSIRTSHWKVYRIVDPEQLNKKKELKLEAILMADIPPKYLKWREMDFSNYYNEKSEVQLLGMNNEPQEQKSYNDQLPAIDATSNVDAFDEKLLEAHRDRLDYEADFRNYLFTLYASPLRSETINDILDLNYGAKFANLIRRRFLFETEFHQRQQNFNNFLTDQSFSLRQTEVNTHFYMMRLTKKLDYFAKLDYLQQRQGSIYPIKSQVRFGFFGIKYTPFKTWRFREFYLSYIPLLERRVSQRYDATSSAEVTDSTPINELSESGLRHEIKFHTRVYFTNDISFIETLRFRPIQRSSSFKVDFGDVDLENIFGVSFRIYKNFFLDFQNIYTWDSRRPDQNNLPSTNNIYTVNFRMDWVI